MDRLQFERLLAARATRRALLAGGGAAGLLAAVSFPGRPTRALDQGTPGAGPGESPAATPRLGGYPFTLGVASGDPLPEGVVLWTRLAPDPLNGGGMAGQGPVEVAYEVAEDEAFAKVVLRGTAIADPALGHSVHVDATGLRPGREYVYRFMAGGEVSPVGRTKTAPAAGRDVERLRFAFASCAHWEHGYFAAYRHLAGEDLDLVVHLGDYLYEYAAGAAYAPETGAVRRHTGGETTTLEAYRNRHALYKTDPDLQAAHAAFPWVTTWDDHETENNYAGAISENGEPEAAFLERRAAAYQAYYEHLPLRPSSMPQGPDLRLYRRLAYGNLAEFSMLDTRQYRSDQPCGDGVQARCAAAQDPERTMTGPEQERWLLRGLDESGARWKVIAQQVMLAELMIPRSGERQFNLDQWDGYPAARNRILGHVMSRAIPNTMVLTGDIHSAWISDLKADFEEPASATVATEFVTSSITADNPFANQLRLLVPVNDHIRYYDGRHGYGRCEVTPERWQTDVRAMENVTEPDAAIETVASFVVEAGQPGAQRG